MTTQPDINYTELFDGTAAGPGALVWWTLHNTRITPDAMRQILRDEGDDPSSVPDIDPTSRIRKVGRSWRSGARTGDDRFRAEVAMDDGMEIVIGILQREQVTGRKVAWVQVDNLVWDQVMNTWISKGASDQAKEFHNECRIAMTHLDHEWLRPKLLTPRLTGAGFKLRPGVFFVPTSLLDRAAKLQRIIKRVGACSLHIAHIEATPASQAALGSAARDSIVSSLDDVMDRLDAWTTRSRKITDAQESKVMLELQDLRNRADLYADALKIRLDDLGTAVDDAMGEAKRILTAQDAGVDAGAVKIEAKPDPSVVAALEFLIGKIEPDEGEPFEIPGDLAASQELPLGPANYAFWNTAKGRGFASAAECGYASRLTRKRMVLPDGSEVQADLLMFRPLVAAGEAASGDPIDAAIAAANTIDTGADLDDTSSNGPNADPGPGNDGDAVTTESPDDAEADLRERLANKSPDEIVVTYRQTMGHDPDGLDKREMVESIVGALA